MVKNNLRVAHFFESSSKQYDTVRYYNGSVLDPHPTLHFDADPDPDPSFQLKGQNFEKVLKKAHIDTFWLVFCKLMRIRIRIPVQLITLMRKRIRIQLITLMRIRILPLNLMRIRILPFNQMRIRIHDTEEKSEKPVHSLQSVNPVN